MTPYNWQPKDWANFKFSMAGGKSFSFCFGKNCCKAVDLLYSAAGSSAIYTKSKISYHFANAQVIRQHGFANESRYETAAQVYLGLQPDLPVLAF